MIVSVPAHTNSIAPVPLTALLTPTGANSTGTIPFQSVLDSLEGFDPASDENVWEGQQQEPQGPPSKKAASDPVSGLQQQNALQYVPPQIPFLSVQDSAKLTATPTPPAHEADAQQNATPEETSTPDATVQPQVDAARPMPSNGTATSKIPSKQPEIAQAVLPSAPRSVVPQSPRVTSRVEVRRTAVSSTAAKTSLVESNKAEPATTETKTRRKSRRQLIRRLFRKSRREQGRNLCPLLNHSAEIRASAEISDFSY